jgi:transcriptional repressor NrdR
VICPFCNVDNDKVIDSRASDAGRVIRRRRHCLACDRRFTTYERVEQTSRLMVVKKDGSRVPFSRENVLRGIQAACGKRPVPAEVKERMADDIEEELHREFDKEVSSRAVGDRVIRKLRAVDEVACFRFASEHLDLTSMKDLRRQLEEEENRVKDVKEQQALF